MSSSVPRTPGPRRGARAAGIATIAVLSVVSLVLVVLALTQHRDPETVPTSTSSLVPVIVPSAEPSPTPSPEAPEPVVAIVPQTTLLSVAGPSGIYRATVGSCGAVAPGFASSADAGSTWQSSDVAALAGAGAVLSLQATETQLGSVVLSDADCSATYVRSFVGGADWEPFPDGIASQWYAVPGASEIVTPLGLRATPCPIASWQGVGETGVILCTDGTLAVSPNSGDGWSGFGMSVAAASLAMGGGVVNVALVDTPECLGVKVVQMAFDGSVSDPGGCAAGPVEPGSVALTIDPAGELWLWTGASLLSSRDAGATW